MSNNGDVEADVEHLSSKGAAPPAAPQSVPSFQPRNKKGPNISRPRNEMDQTRSPSTSETQYQVPYKDRRDGPPRRGNQPPRPLKFGDTPPWTPTQQNLSRGNSNQSNDDSSGWNQGQKQYQTEMQTTKLGYVVSQSTPLVVQSYDGPNNMIDQSPSHQSLSMQGSGPPMMNISPQHQHTHPQQNMMSHQQPSSNMNNMISPNNMQNTMYGRSPQGQMIGPPSGSNTLQPGNMIQVPTTTGVDSDGNRIIYPMMSQPTQQPMMMTYASQPQFYPTQTPTPIILNSNMPRGYPMPIQAMNNNISNTPTTPQSTMHVTTSIARSVPYQSPNTMFQQQHQQQMSTPQSSGHTGIHHEYTSPNNPGYMQYVPRPPPSTYATSPQQPMPQPGIHKIGNYSMAGGGSSDSNVTYIPSHMMNPNTISSPQQQQQQQQIHSQQQPPMVYRYQQAPSTNTNLPQLSTYTLPNPNMGQLNTASGTTQPMGAHTMNVAPNNTMNTNTYRPVNMGQGVSSQPIISWMPSQQTSTTLSGSALHSTNNSSSSSLNQMSSVSLPYNSHIAVNATSGNTGTNQYTTTVTSTTNSIHSTPNSMNPYQSSVSYDSNTNTTTSQHPPQMTQLPKAKQHKFTVKASDGTVINLDELKKKSSNRSSPLRSHGTTYYSTPQTGVTPSQTTTNNSPSPSISSLNKTLDNNSMPRNESNDSLDNVKSLDSQEIHESNIPSAVIHVSKDTVMHALINSSRNESETKSSSLDIVETRSSIPNVISPNSMIETKSVTSALTPVTPAPIVTPVTLSTTESTSSSPPINTTNVTPPVLIVKPIEEKTSDNGHQIEEISHTLAHTTINDSNPQTSETQIQSSISADSNATDDWETQPSVGLNTVNTMKGENKELDTISSTVAANASSTTTTTTTTGGASKLTTPAYSIPDKKGKKFLKSKIANMEANEGKGSMLDAYIDTPVSPAVSVPEPTTATTSTTTPVASTTPVTAVEENEPEVDDDWEKTADKIELKPVEPVAPRRLAPGGGKQQTKLNVGVLASTKPIKPKFSYTKEEIMKMKPSTIPERPTHLNTYSNILVHEEADKRVINTKTVQSMGYYKFDSKFSHTSYDRQNRDQSSKDGRSGTGGGGGGQGFSSGSNRDHNTSGSTSGYTVGGSNVNTGDDGGWKRGEAPPQPPSQTAPQQQKRVPRAPMVRPSKVITDPVAQLSTEVMQILNKITPQTFEKLTMKLCEIVVPTNALLDKLIELVFEKAIQEQYFSNLYADMCAALENESRYWAFLQVVYNKDDNSYFWILDLEFDNELCGPYKTVDECVQTAVSSEPLNFNTVNFKVHVAELIVYHDILIKVFKKVQNNNNNTTTTEEYYFSYVPFADLNKDTLSTNTFATLETAQKDAQKKNSFRRRLISICQQEFQNSTSNEGMYSAIKEYDDWKHTISKTLSAEERAQQGAEWEDRCMKLKKRMLGNIRFIGELYKKGLISTKIMHECVVHLIGKNNENGEWIGWKDEPDEQDLEILCKFIPTIGATLESKASKDQNKVLEWYFDRLLELSQDKRYNSRIRFSLEEVITLRNNNWKARREQEGPAKIEEIHQKIAMEEQMRAQQQQQQAAAERNQSGKYGGGGSSGRYSMTSGGGDRGGGYSQRGSMYQQDSGSGRGNQSARGQGGGGGGDTRGSMRGQGSNDRFSRQSSVGPGTSYPRHSPTSSSSAGGYNSRNDLKRMQSAPLPKGANDNSDNQSSQRYSLSQSSSSSSLRGNGGNGGGSGGGVDSLSPPSGSHVSRSTTDYSSQINGVIKEYLFQKDIQEVKLRLSELGSEACGTFIHEILSKYLDCHKPDIKSLLANIFIPLSDVLIPAKSYIEMILRESELLRSLPGLMSDIPDAPDRIATIIHPLIRMGACDQKAFFSIMDNCCSEENAEEHMCSVEDLREIYGKIIVILKKE